MLSLWRILENVLVDLMHFFEHHILIYVCACMRFLSKKRTLDASACTGRVEYYEK